ncbi:MAG: HEAT repeat domain-containing protein [Deltaproteobacteria bacterium]|nr:HEAT repeat domain-containing protein [Deltaproteobacteria bacterium]
MSEILGEPPTDQLIHSFGYELSRRIQSLHTTPLASEWQSLLIGTLRVTAPSSCPHPLELDYCIGRAESGETVILGLWDPANKEPNRWRNICNQLKGRGLERSQSVITDEAVGSANAFITILNPDIGDDVFRDDATENSTPVPTILLEHALPEDAEIEEVMSHKEELIPVRPTAHMSAPSLVLPSIAFVLLVLFGGFYSSAKESIASSLSASTAESAHTGSLSPTGSQLVGPLERQILKELKDHASESENIAAIIRVAAHSQNGEILEELINLSDHQDSVVRASVAQAIAYGSEVSSPKRMRSLLRLLVDPDFLVRGMAAKSLGKIGTADAIEALQLRLKYEDNGVVRRVIEKLVREKGFVFSR